MNFQPCFSTLGENITKREFIGMSRVTDPDLRTSRVTDPDLRTSRVTDPDLVRSI